MFSRNIKYLRKKYELTQDELAKRLGYKSFVTISKWESGASKPRASELEKLCAIFNVSVDQLLYKDIESNLNSFTAEQQHSVRIKVFGSVPAGIPTEAIEDVVGWEDIPIEWTTGAREYFALKVKGDSRYPKYQNGDTIIIRKQNECENGQDCVVYVNGYDATLKTVIKESDRITLRPFNSKYPLQSYRYDDAENPVIIAGVVVEIRRTI